MKKLSDAATALNEEIIAKHGYTKFNSHLDFFKLTTIEGFFDIDDYFKLQRKYISKDSDKAWEIRVRLSTCKLFDDMKETESQQKHYRIMESLLDEGKHKNIPFGQHLYACFLKRKLQFTVKLMKDDEIKTLLVKYKDLMNELGCAENPLVKLQMISLQRQTRKYGIVRGTDDVKDFALYESIFDIYEQSETKLAPLVV